MCTPKPCAPSTYPCAPARHAQPCVPLGTCAPAHPCVPPACSLRAPCVPPACPCSPPSCARQPSATYALLCARRLRPARNAILERYFIASRPLLFVENKGRYYFLRSLSCAVCCLVSLFQDMLFLL